ncbi:MAG: acyl carrier protein [Pseudonocardia sp.]
MSPDDALATVRAALEASLGVPADQVVPSATLREDLELDSLDLAELVAGLEERTGRPFGTEMLAGVHTVADVVRLISSLAADAAP